MAIPFDRYILITSAVGGGQAVPRREFLLRIFTTNELIPTNSIIEFTSADDVSDYFGSSSEEFMRSSFYFGFVSKLATSPQRISFSRWADVDTAPQIFGNTPAPLATLQAITNGTLDIEMGGAILNLANIDFSTAISLADVASILQTAIRTGLGNIFTMAVVNYNAVDARFELTGGETGNNTVSIIGGDIVNSIGWGVNAIFSNGITMQSVTDVLSDSAEMSNNFGSFVFTTASALTLDEIVEAATWNATRNVQFQYHVPVELADAATTQDPLQNIRGVGLTLVDLTNFPNEYDEQSPASILAATDYDRRASSQNYMFNMFNLTPKVSTSEVANMLDALQINYYGVTQTAGQNISFYQRGFLQGISTDPVNMNVYANEQWLKDAIGSSLGNLLLALPEVSANEAGRAQILSAITPVTDQALINGTITTNKPLNSTQIAFISQITGDPLAFQQVRNAGFWLNAFVESEVNNGVTEFFARYTLIYSKDDVIRRVVGSQILI